MSRYTRVGRTPLCPVCRSPTVRRKAGGGFGRPREFDQDYQCGRQRCGAHFDARRLADGWECYNVATEDDA